LKNLTRAFENNRITDTYLAMCFGLTVFSAIVVPFLSSNIAIAASVVLLLFIGLFASGFSLYVLKDGKIANLPIVSLKSMVAHELRTPLGGIFGISELLIQGAEGDLTPQVNLNLKLIAESGRRLTYLLNDILDMSKIRYQSIHMLEDHT
jgi:signal transduction histidine kinase